jgi:excisionase family DNA binding protein
MSSNTSASPALPEYLTAVEVANLLRVTPKSLYRLLEREPTLPVLRLGRGASARLRFPRQRLETWLRQRERNSSPRVLTSVLPDRPCRRSAAPLRIDGIDAL